MRILPTQLPDGRPCEPSKVVPVDAITYMSGVNYGSVVKVLAAMNAMDAGSSMTIEEMVDLARVPLNSLRPGYQDITGRRRNTDKYVRALAKLRMFDSFEALLATRGRLGIE